MKKILIVDDNEASITLLLSVLGNRYELSVALSGEEALESLIEELPDLIILDIVMDGINGIDLCKKLKQDHVTAHIPVILLSATNNALSNKAREAGADALVGKPFKVDYFLSKIAKLIG
jgi:CheY-like chemotaxis protein